MGSTYTRQSSYTDGDVIQASDTNDEFDQLLAAFAADTGHTHDGTTAEGGPITKLLGNTLTFGAGTAGTDITITFDGETNDGELKWMEDEDYFEFSDDILIASTEKLQFRDTAIYINSSTDGQLDIVADTEIQIAATTIDINGNVDISGTLTIGSAGISEAELEILDGANVTTAELNIMDGDTSATSTTVADADRVVFNDAGTMKQVAVTDLAAYFDDEITAMPNLVTTAATTVGALNSGSITSGFGTIDTGSSTITTTGLISGGSLDIDDVLINGTTIGHTDDTDLITLANGVVTVAGEVSMTTLDIGGTNVTSTAAELNIVDGGTSATSTTVADADRVVMNDNGTMVQVAVTDLAAYFDDEITAMPNLVTTAATTVGALNSGSITSGFGTIDTGSSNITTTGVGSFGSLDISGDIDVDGTTNLDVVDIDGAVDMASTLQLDGAITLGVAGASNGFINSPSGIFVNIDSDNNQTDRFFDIRKDSTDGSGTLLFQVLESGAATFNGNVSVSEANNTSSLVSARYNSSNRKIGFNVNNSNGQGFLAFNCNSVSGSGNQTYDTTGVAAKIDYTGDMTFDIAASGTAGNTISFSEAMRIDSNGNVVVGGTSAQASDAATLMADGEVTAAGFYFSNNIGSAMNDTGIRRATTSTMVFDTASTERMRIDSNGNVGIGQSPNMKLNILHADEDGIRLNTADGAASFIDFGDASDNDIGRISYDHADNHMAFRTNNAEVMRIDSDGKLLVGTTNNSLYNTSTQSHAGVLLDGVNDNLQVARYQGTPAFFNRLNNDGDIIDLRKDGSPVGSIGVQGGDTYFAGTSKGIKAVSGFIGATNTTGVLQDNNTDLGSSSYRFKDLYLSGKITNDGTGGIQIDTSGNVGIGTSSPNKLIELSAESDPRIRINNSDISLTANQIIGGLEFYTNDPSSSGTGIGASIDAYAQSNFGSNQQGLYLTFSTRDSGSGETNTERMRIDSSGNVLVGTTDNQPWDNSGTSTGAVLRSDGLISSATNGQSAIELNRLSSDGNIANFRRSGALVGSIGVASTDHFYFAAADGAGLKVDSDLSSGVTPCNSSGADLDASINIGHASARWNNLYLSADIIQKTTSATIINRDIDVNRTGSNQTLGRDRYFWNGTEVVRVEALTGSDTTNKDDGALRIGTASAGTVTERMRIDSSGHVGIGQSNPLHPLHISDTSGNTILELQRTNTNASGTVGAISFTASDDHSVAAIHASGDGDNEGAHLIFRTTSAASENNYFNSTSEHMRLDSSGKVIIGSTGTVATSDSGLSVVGSTTDNLSIQYTGTTGGHTSKFQFVDFRGQVNASINNNLINDGSGTASAHLDFNTSVGGALSQRVRIGGDNQTETVFNDLGLNYDFRIESDGEANMFLIDANENKAFIGGSVSSYDANRLNIRGPSVVPGGTNGNLGIYSTDAVAAGVGGSLTLGGKYSGSTYYMFGGIQAVKRNATGGDASGQMKFYYVNNSNSTIPYHIASQDEIQFNPDGNDVDFRVESNAQTHMLFVDAGNNHVNIGTTTDHGGVLNVETTDNNVNLVLVSTDTDGNEGPILDLTRDAGNVPSDADQMGLIRFRNDNTDLVMHTYASIGAVVGDSSAGTEDGTLNIQTIVAGTSRDRITIRASGVVFNEESLDSDFRVESDSNSHMLFVDASSGNIFFGASSTSAPTMYFAPDSGGGAFISNKDSTNSRRAFEFQNPNGTIGSIDLSGSATAFATSSDYRLKENVVYDWDATTRLKQLKPARFNFIADADTTVDGFLAHEAQSVVPEAITGTHNEVDADGNPVYQGIDQSKLVPLLVKTIQELEARITALENA